MEAVRNVCSSGEAAMTEPSEKGPDETLRRLAEEIRVWREEALRGPDGLDDRTLAAYVSGELDDAERMYRKALDTF